MNFIRTLLEQQPLLALFLTIAIGYVVGEINIKGLSLGVGAVLFVALGVGWFAPQSAPPGMLGTFGLGLFLYAVGIQYGKQFIIGLTSAAGLKANLIALVGVLFSGAVSLLLIKIASLKSGYAIGLFAGSCTSTPTLQAAIAVLGNDDPAVGYSVAYPFGVAFAYQQRKRLSANPPSLVSLYLALMSRSVSATNSLTATTGSNSPGRIAST